MGSGAWRSCPGSRPGRRRPGPLIPGTCGQDLAHEGGPPARATGLGGDIGPLGAWGDELAGQVGQNHSGGVGAGDSDTLKFQGRDDLAGPGGVASAPVGFEPGVSPCLARALQVGWGGPGGDGPQRRRRAPGHGPRVGSGVSHWPRMRPSVCLTWRARSRSKPVSMLSAAASSSEALTALRVWGMLLAAPAMTAASFASVVALPGARSAMRRIDSPGR